MKYALNSWGLCALFSAMGKAIGCSEVVIFCNVNDDTVLAWINCLNPKGIDGQVDRPRCGAHKRYDPS
jgi:hypothetical protein